MKNDKTKDKMYKLICYMATSACNLVGEPHLYGPFRLVDAISRLIDIMEEAGFKDEHLEQARDLIEQDKYLVMNDEEGFSAFMDKLVLHLAEGLSKPKQEEI